MIKLTVRPRVFWVSITILLIAGISFYMLKERTLKIYLERDLTRVIGQKKVIENRLVETIKSKKRVENKLVSEKERSYVLEKEVKQRDRQIKIALDKFEKEIAVRRQAEARLIIGLERIRALEARLRGFTNLPVTLELEKIIVKPVPELRGRLLAVNKEHKFILVDLGRANNLELGNILSVYRGGEFIGRVRVERMEERICAAAILPDWQEVEFKQNDEVEGI